MENKAFFLEAGGKEYGYIPCLNAESAHIDMLVNLVMRHAGGWTDASGYPSTDELARRKGRAIELGAEK